MMIPDGIVFVIDDDASVRRSLKHLLTSAEYQTEVFKSADEFLARPPHPGPACLLIDVQMPGLNGMDLQKALIERRRDEQLIFITGHGDIQMCAQAMKAGAADFLPKPLESEELLGCVERALSRSKEQRQHIQERDGARAMLDQLTPRQFEVMQLLVTGMLNKQVGNQLGLTEKTVKVHRGCVMKKLGLTSVAGLVSLMVKAEIPVGQNLKTKVQ
jgi:FixJ family two-component response regulator